MTITPQVIVSLATTPTRINKIKQTIDSILKQSVVPHKIYIVAPKICKRENKPYIIPDWIKNGSESINNIKIVIRDWDFDYGAANKLLGLLDIETHPDTQIITIDDDIVYHKHMIKKLLHHSHQNNSAIIANKGWYFNNYYNTLIERKLYDKLPSSLRVLVDHRETIKQQAHDKQLQDNSLVLMTGTGCIFKRGLIDDDIFTQLQEHPTYFGYGNDLFFAAYFSRKGIPRINLNCNGICTFLKYGKQADALSTSGNSITNYIVGGFLLELATPDVWFK